MPVNGRFSQGVDVPKYTPPNPSSCSRHDAHPVGVYISFEISYQAQIPVHKHSSWEHIIMHFLKRLWQWYTDRRIERRMLKGPGVYRTQTNQSHIPGRKMPTLPISTNS
jgi:hypothetical protein